MATAFDHKPSEKQAAIFRWFTNIKLHIVEHLVIRARAGTGKTSTICEALKYVPRGLKILVCAFGKDIQLELAARLQGTPAEARTLHSLGLSFVYRMWPGIKPNYSKDRENSLAESVCGARVPETIKKLVAKLCTQGRLMAPLAHGSDELVNIAIEFECVPDVEWEDQGYDLEYVTARAYEAMELAASTQVVEIDGADMLYLPVRNRWLVKKYDVVVVDEGQDMNACQLLIAQGVCKGRLIVVGDDRQAIYAFAGADSGSLDRLKRTLNATELPLNVTYRCGKSIVAVAQRYVPDFEADIDNPAGEVLELAQEKLVETAGPTDFILSRVNAPLVSIAMRLLKAGKRTRIAGRDIGDGLVRLIRKLKGKSVPDLLVKIERWDTREVARLMKQMDSATEGRKKTVQQKIDAIHDQASMMISLAEGAPNVESVVANIEKLFSDKESADMIVCSSIHKAKGKEANRVFVLKSTLRDNSQEEQNIAYVAVTRAKQTLVWVL